MENKYKIIIGIMVLVLVIGSITAVQIYTELYQGLSTARAGWWGYGSVGNTVMTFYNQVGSISFNALTNIDFQKDLTFIDNLKIKMGTTSTDLQISSDGTNPVYNSTGIHTFYNTTGLGTIRIGSILYSSPENKDYSALDKLVNPTTLTTDSKSELEFHQSFPVELQKTIQVNDPTKCVEYNITWTAKEGDPTPLTKKPKNEEDYFRNSLFECETKDELVISGADWDMFNYKGVWELDERTKNLQTQITELKTALCKYHPEECLGKV